MICADASGLQNSTVRIHQHSIRTIKKTEI